MGVWTRLRSRRGEDRPRARPRALPYLLVALALVVVVFFGRWMTAPGGPILTGDTAQKQFVEITLDRSGYPASVSAGFIAWCGSGVAQPMTWAPDRRPAGSATNRQGSFLFRDVHTEEYPNGSRRRVAAVMAGRIVKGAGEGTARLVSRLDRPADRPSICDTDEVAWSVGPGSERRLAARARADVRYPTRKVNLAVPPRRRAFIELVDRTCAVEYRKRVNRERAAALRVMGREDAWRRVAAVRAEGRSVQYRALKRLGRPIDGRDAYDDWLGNMADRIAVERRKPSLSELDAAALERRLEGLKAEGRVHAQRFGLLTCLP